MRNMTLSLLMLLSLNGVAIGATPRCVQEDELDHIVIFGTVIAYNLSLLSVVKLTSVPNNDLILVRVNRSVSGQLKSRYAIVRYEYWNNEPRLPDGFHNAKAQWRLELKRDSLCDRSVSDVLSRKNSPGAVILRPLQWKQMKRGRLLNEMIPCYVLHPTGLSLYSSPMAP